MARKVLVDGANAAELRWFLTKTYDLEIHPSTNAPALRNKLRELGYDQPEIEIDAEEAAAPTEDPGDLEATLAENAELKRQIAELKAETQRVEHHLFHASLPDLEADERVKSPPHPMKTWMIIRIGIREDEGRMGREPVPVMCNGDLLLIPRAKTVLVRYPYVHILRHAVKTIYDEIIADDTLDELLNVTALIPKRVFAYPIEVCSAPIVEDTEMWNHPDVVKLRKQNEAAREKAIRVSDGLVAA